MKIVERRARIAFGMALLLALVAGCGGGGGGASTGGGNNGGGTDQALTDAQDDLTDLLKQDPGTVTLADLAEARDKFQQAVDADPDSVPGNTGLAVTQSALAYQRLAELFGYGVSQLRSPSESRGLEKMARRGVLHSIAGGGLDPTNAAVGASDLFATTGRGRAEDPTPEEIWVMIGEIEPELETALSIVNAMPRSSEVLMIPDAENPNQMVAFGQPERDAMEATLYASLGLINFVRSWNLNPAAFPYDQAAQSAYGVSADSDEPITPDTYLPGGTFGQLGSSGAARLQKFKAYWLEAAEVTRTAIDGVKARGNGNYVISADMFAPGALDAARASTTQFEDLLNGPVVVQDVEMWFDLYDITVNLNAWITSPPADLTAFAPNLVLTRDDTTGSPEIAIEVDLDGSYPDPTFGGLFPNGLPLESIEERTDWLPWDATRADVAAWAFQFFYFRYSL